ncbi:MAG TPA: glycerophosphodiester phosphodiesterase family protein [Croceibacterium sp.]
MLSSLDRRLAPAPDPARVAWLRGQVYAHRGKHGAGLIENSQYAFDAAIAADLGIECDVQETADGEAAVFHDRELDRLTASTGPVIARTALELLQTRLTGSHEHIPLLGDLLLQVSGRVPLLIEVKTDPARRVERLCRAVQRGLGDYDGPCAVMSFDSRVGFWFARHAPQTVRGLVVTERGGSVARGPLLRRLGLWNTRPDFLAYDVRDLPSPFAAVQRARGLPLLTWTVSDAARLKTARAHADAPIAEGEGLASLLARS